MITLKTLERLPEFAPVKVAVEKYAEEHGAAHLKEQLDRGEVPANEAMVRWILDAPTAEVHANRLEALYIILRAWEQRRGRPS